MTTAINNARQRYLRLGLSQSENALAEKSAAENARTVVLTSPAEATLPGCGGLILIGVPADKADGKTRTAQRVKRIAKTICVLRPGGIFCRGEILLTGAPGYG